MRVTSVAVMTTKVLFGMCEFMVDINVGKGNILLMQGILHRCGHMHMQLHVTQGMDCCK